MILIVTNSLEKNLNWDNIPSQDIFLMSFSEEAIFKVKTTTNNSSLPNTNYLHGKDFSSMRNYVIDKFLNSKDHDLFYINLTLKNDNLSLEESIKNLIKIKDKFIFNIDKKIVGFSLSNTIVKQLGGHNYLSQLLIKKNKEEDEETSLLVSNEALDFDYLYRFIKYKELLGITNKQVYKEEEEEIYYKEKFKSDPLFYRNKIDGIKISDYYMLYMNSIAAFKNQIFQSDQIIKEYEKVFKRIKIEAISHRDRLAQFSYILGLLYYKPIF